MNRLGIPVLIFACGVLFPANPATAQCDPGLGFRCTVQPSCARVGDTIAIAFWGCYSTHWQLGAHVTQGPIDGIHIEWANTWLEGDGAWPYICPIGPAYGVGVPLQSGCAPKVTFCDGGGSWVTIPLSSVTRGDLNLNGIRHEVSDLVTLINIAFRHEPPNEGLRECWPVQADLDYNGRLNLVDIVRMWQIITGNLPPHAQ